MTQETLAQQWAENKDRPAWVQANREALAAATGLDDIPRSRSAIEDYLRRKKGVITRRLTESTGDQEDTD